MGDAAGTAVALPCPVVRISVTGGVTVPVDKTEEVSLGDRLPEPSASPAEPATFARGSEPFARVLVDDSQTRVVAGDPNTRVLVDERHTRVLAGFPTRIVGEPTRTRRASEPNVEPERYDLGNVI